MTRYLTINQHITSSFVLGSKIKNLEASTKFLESESFRHGLPLQVLYCKVDNKDDDNDGVNGESCVSDPVAELNVVTMKQPPSDIVVIDEFSPHTIQEENVTSTQGNGNKTVSFYTSKRHQVI